MGCRARLLIWPFIGIDLSLSSLEQCTVYRVIACCVLVSETNLQTKDFKTKNVYFYKVSTMYTIQMYKDPVTVRCISFDMDNDHAIKCNELLKKEALKRTRKKYP